METTIAGLENLEEEDFSELFDKISELMGDDKKDEPVVHPESKIDARKWVLAILKSDKEEEFLKTEYLPYIVEKYVQPIKNKIQRMNDQKEFLKIGLKEFLKDIEEDNISFPDIGTVYITSTPEKIVWPEEKKDEEELVKKLVEEKATEYIKTEYKLDKKKANEDFKMTKIIPIEGLDKKEAGTTVGIRKVK